YRLSWHWCRRWRRCHSSSLTLLGLGRWRWLCGHSRRCGCELRGASALGWRRRWRRWRGKRLQILQSLRVRAHLAVQQQPEYIVRQLRINRQLRRDQQLGPFLKWQAFFAFPALWPENLYSFFVR